MDPTYPTLIMTTSEEQCVLLETPETLHHIVADENLLFSVTTYKRVSNQLLNKEQLWEFVNPL